VNTAPGTASLGLWRGMLLFAPIVLLGHIVGASLRYPQIGSAVVFPAYAALTAVLLLAPRRDWGWYIAVELVTHFAASWPKWSASWVLLAAVANIARSLVAVAMLRWAFKGPRQFEDVPGLARFLFAAVLVAPAAGATIGAMNVVIHSAPQTYWRTWVEWFLSNALTGLTILPALMLGATYVARSRRPRVSRAQLVEVAAIAASLVLSCIVAFLVPTGSRWELALRLYAPLPVLIWMALRFGTGVVSLGLTAITFGAIWSADREAGLFSAATPDENVLVLQLFVAVTAVPVLCIAAVSAARRGVVHLHGALLASLQDHVAILDAAGNVVEVNGSWRRFAHSSAAVGFHRVLVGANYLDACRLSAVRDDPIATRALAGVARVLAREATRVEMEYDDHLRGHRRYALSFEALEGGEGGAVVTRADVTARYQTQMQMEEQRRELSHLARVTALGQLSGALAHELNQPLTSISNNAEAARHLLKRHPLDFREIDAALGDILAQDQRAAQVIKRLRALLARGETRVLPLDAAELVADVLELAHAELINRGVSASAVISHDLPAVLADRIQVQQVLLNLILNACEAMQADGRHPRRLSLVVVADASNHIRFSVRDSGSGIPASLSDHLFEPFVTTKKEGLGLGLSISRTIVAAHGGRIWAENNADGGATLHCVFPSAKVRGCGDDSHRGGADRARAAGNLAASA
jgi:two-component system, LuxR family, sensor kinase FixL